MEKFTLTHEQYIESSALKIKEYTHRTGLHVFYLDNNAEEKIFAAAFKTVPDSSQGMFHILEHSILSGSENYPISSPIKYMMTNSLKTYINASTYGDKTLFPVASANETDFYNLMGVYCDAVFKPLLSKNIFYREGWHVEQDPEGEYHVSGVVYNEMIGSMANTQAQVYHNVLKTLYPHTFQAFISGGEPADIPSLSYDDFIKTYKKYYSVKNCVIILSGNQDLERSFKLLDDYIESASQEEQAITYSLEKMGHYEANFTYEVGSEEELQNNDYNVLSFNIGDYEEEKKELALSLLDKYFLGNPSAPLKKALMESGLCGDVVSMITPSRQNSYSFILLQCKPNSRKDIEHIIKDVLQHELEKGLNQDTLKALIKNLKFSCKEGAANLKYQTLDIIDNVVDNYFFGCDMTTYLDNDRTLRFADELLEQHGFEEIIKEVFFDNVLTAKLTMTPVLTNPNSRQELERKALSHYSKEELKALCEDNLATKHNYRSQDNPENLSKMPKLSLSDINYKVTPNQLIKKNNYYYLKAETQGIVYINYYFNVNDFSFEELCATNFLMNNFYKFKVKGYDTNAYYNKLQSVFGINSCNLLPMQYRQEPCIKKVEFNLSYLYEDKAKADEIFQELFTLKEFDEELINQLKEQEYQNLKDYYSEGAMDLAMLYSGGHYEEDSALNSRLLGEEYFTFLKQDSQTIKKALETVYEKTFSHNRLSYSFMFKEELNGDIALKDNEIGPNQSISLLKGPIGIAVPSNVNYNVQTIKYDDLLDYSRKGNVVMKLINMNYLWHNVREKGNAYGCNLQINQKGTIKVSSFRDPHCLETFNIFKGIADYLKTHPFSQSQIEGTIISMFGPLLKPKNNQTIFDLDLANYFNHMSDEECQRLIDEMKETTVEDVDSFIPIFERLSKNGDYVNIGSKKSMEDSHLFEKIKNI